MKDVKSDQHNLVKQKNKRPYKYAWTAYILVEIIFNIQYF